MEHRAHQPWPVVLASSAGILLTDLVLSVFLAVDRCTEVVADGSSLDAYCTGFGDVWGSPLLLFPSGLLLLAGGFRPPARVFLGIALTLWLAPPVVALALLP